ncbi:MAG: type II toxin-antitoxin system VapB family antitoxin [Thermoleophilia bacterium]
METMAKKHTSLYIDEQLLADAQRLLSTSGPTETVNRALKEAVELELRRGLLSTPFGITEEELQDMRHQRGAYERPVV